MGGIEVDGALDLKGNGGRGGSRNRQCVFFECIRQFHREFHVSESGDQFNGIIDECYFGALFEECIIVEYGF